MTVKWLRTHFRYHPSGYLIRRKGVGGPTYAGQKVKGCRTSTNGYRSVTIRYRSWLLHRVIFLLEKGYLPRFLDHIDRDRKNNRIGNLREASKRLNCFNRSVSKNTVSGIRGVTYVRKKKIWRGRICIFGKSHFLGSSKNKQKIVNRVKREQFKILKTLE